MKVGIFHWVVLGMVALFGHIGSTGRPGGLLVSFVLSALLIVVCFLDWSNEENV